MRCIFRFIRNVILLGFLCIIGYGIYLNFAEAKSFSVDSLVVDAAIQQDGSMVVKENRTLTFKNGPFTRAYIDIPKKGFSALSDISVQERDRIYEYTEEGESRPDGYFTVQEYIDSYHIEWYYSIVEGTREFSVSYTVLDCVKVFKDTAELYWKFVGDDNSGSIDYVKVNLLLPQEVNKEDIKVFGHGPLEGRVEILSGNEAMWETEKLPMKEFFEARILFPTSIVSGAKNIEEMNAYSSIMAEEEAWAAEGDKERNKHKFYRYVNIGIIILVILTIILLYLKFGRKLRPAQKYDYYRELPGDYTPAELVVLMNFGKVKGEAFSSTLMDLGRKGYISFERVGEKRRKDIVLHKIKKNDGNLTDHEEYLINFLFNKVSSNRKSTSIKEIKTYSKRRNYEAYNFWNTWQGKIKSTDVVKKFKDKKSLSTKSLLKGISVIFIVAWVIIVVLFQVLEFAIGLIVCAVIFWLSSFVFPRRTAYGEEQLMMWKAFRKFLKDFSSLDSAELPQLILWEQYLVYATALGVAKQVLKQLPYVYPELKEQNQSDRMKWYGMYDDYSFGEDNMSDLNTITEMTASIATMGVAIQAISNSYRESSSSSSSDGGGGGFSSGGGDGGGGSSFGAD